MLRKRSPPIEPARGDAPSTATLSGSKKARSEATTAVWSRSSTWARYASVGASGNSSSTIPCSSLRATSNPASVKTPKHGAVLGQDLRDEALDPVPRSDVRELLEQARPDAAALQVVRDRERHLGRGRVPEAGVCRDGDDALAPRRRRGFPSARRGLPSRARVSGSTSAGVDGRHPVEAQVQALGRQSLEELAARGGVGLARRTKPERAPVSQDDVGDLRLGDHRAPSCRRFGSVTP